MDIPEITNKRIYILLLIYNRLFKKKRNPFQEFIYQNRTFWIHDINYWVQYTLSDGIKDLNYSELIKPKENKTKRKVFIDLDTILWNSNFYIYGSHDVRYGFMIMKKNKIQECYDMCNIIYSEVKKKYPYRQLTRNNFLRPIIENSLQCIVEKRNSVDDLIKLAITLTNLFYTGVVNNKILECHLDSNFCQTYTPYNIKSKTEELKQYHIDLIAKLT